MAARTGGLAMATEAHAVSQDGTDSPDDRLARRRARRWKRRARIAGPLLAVPAILALLALSVDLIEYHPAKPAARPDALRSEPPAAKAPASATPMGADALGVTPFVSVSVLDSTYPGPGPAR